MEERLQKILAQAGIASRRAAEKYISEGRVRVNGEVVSELGAKADPENDTIEVDGYGVVSAEPLVYMALHKPIHVVTTLKDPEKRQTVIDVIEMSRATGRKSFEGNMPRVFPVGRLDFDAEGLLVLTNDGALSNDLLHPRFHVPKTYVVKVKGRPEQRQLDRLRRGVRLREEDGRTSRPTAPAEVTVVRESPANTWLEVVIHEGRHHQVKRMFEAIGTQVIRLIRTEFGGIELGDLDVGLWRFLTEGEVELLRAWRSGNAADLLSKRRGPRTSEMLFSKGAASKTYRREEKARGYGAPRERSGSGESRGPRSDSRGARSDSRGPRTDSRGPRADSRGPRVDSRGPRADSRGPRVDSRGPRVDSRGPRADSRGPRSDSRGPRADSRGPRTDRRGPAPEGRGPRPARGGPPSEDRGPRRGPPSSGSGPRPGGRRPSGPRR
ncbi:MAG: pseudouridine synthase [Myxococcota bacterium]